MRKVENKEASVFSPGLAIVGPNGESQLLWVEPSQRLKVTMAVVVYGRDPAEAVDKRLL